MTENERRQVINRIINIFHTNGAEEYLGESISVGEHMLQSAYFASQAGGDDDAVIGALIHDVGHFTSTLGAFAIDDIADRLHEDAGAILIEGVLPETVVDCVRHHVAAKRYLCAVDQDYYESLSEASKHSLKLQGGSMRGDECKSFESIPGFDRIVLVRRCDDQGKVKGMLVPPLEHYLPILYRVARLSTH